MRKCKTCGALKPLEEYPLGTGYVEGRKPSCKPCHREYMREKRKSWCPSKRKAHSRKHNYGITESQYEEMLAAQDGKCRICEEVMNPPHVDHCHSSLMVRGLLCKHCNTGLGHFKDKPERLLRAATLTPERRV